MKGEPPTLDFSQNNLRAKIVALQSDGKKQRPALRVKNKGGAPKGNRNALKHGEFAKDALASRRAMRADARRLILRMRALIGQISLATIDRRPKVTVTRIEP